MTIDQILQHQQAALHGEDSIEHKNIPKFINIIINYFEEYLDYSTKLGGEQEIQDRNLHSAYCQVAAKNLICAFLFQNVEDFKQSIIDRLKEAVNERRYQDVICHQIEQDFCRVLSNDQKVERIRKFSSVNKDFQSFLIPQMSGGGKDIKDIGELLSLSQRSNESNLQASILRRNDIKSRQSLRTDKNRNFSIQNSGNPQILLQVTYRAQMMLDFFSSLKTRAIDYKFLDIVQENFQSGRQTMSSDKLLKPYHVSNHKQNKQSLLKYRLKFIERIQKLCNRLMSLLGVQYETIGELLVRQGKFQFDAPDEKQNFNSKDILFFKFMKRLAISLLQLQNEQRGCMSGRKMIKFDSYKNWDQIDQTIQGILNWKHIIANQSISTSTPKIVSMTSSFKKQKINEMSPNKQDFKQSTFGNIFTHHRNQSAENFQKKSDLIIKETDSSLLGKFYSVGNTIAQKGVGSLQIQSLKQRLI